MSLPKILINNKKNLKNINKATEITFKLPLNILSLTRRLLNFVKKMSLKKIH